MTEQSTIPRLFPDTFSIGQVELTGQYTGAVVRGRLFINDQHVSWGGTFNNGFFTYYVGPDRIQRHDKVELVGYDSGNNEIARAVVTIRVETDNALFKKNESLIRIQAERVDPISTKVVFFSHDRGTAKLLFKLEKDGAPQPLSNGTVVPICLEGGSETSDMRRFRHVYHAVIEDATEGLVSIILKNNILGHQGRVVGSIYIKPPNDQQLDTAGRFLFHIEQSPIDNMTESVSQFYYEGFHEIYEKIADVKKVVSDMTTEAQASVDQKIRDLETQINQFFEEAQNKFTSLDSEIVGVKQSVSQLENRLTAVKNEIETLLSNILVATRNYLIDSHIERTGRNEFLNDPSWNLAPLIDEYGMDREYTVSFDLKSAIAGTIRVYCQNGSGAKYDIGQHPLNVTTEYKRFSISFKPTKSAGFDTETRSLLAFFGTYDTGRIPTVRNVSFGLGNVGGDWMPNPAELALKSDLNISARNLLPRSSFYNGLDGWITSSFTSITSNGEYTTISKGVNEVRSTISINLDGIKQSTQYNIGLMVYVESVSAGATGHGTGVFLRTNDGTMQDAPVGYVDFTKVGEWQLITATGTTRPGTWVIPAQPTIAIQASISCTIRIKEFVLVEGNRYLGWFPAPSDKADQKEFEITQQKVQTLEENTINLTNHFPDPKFQKQEPRPFNEGNFAITYDANGVVISNNTATKGRIYWATPPLSLAIGKSYNVAMFVNTDQASVRKQIEVGTSLGENIQFQMQNVGPTWIQGTVRLTTFAAFSIWLDPGAVLRIRELYIYEANTDITTARIERLELDNSLPAVVPTFATGFNNYAASGDNFCQAVRHGDMVTIRGAIAPTSVVSSGNTLNNFLMGTLPVGYGPKHIERQLAQGSGRGLYHLEITTDRRILCSRYRGHNTGYTQDDIPVGSWLVTSITYVGEDI
ncbi:hypothetical protein D931_02311 [Enterococcus faecium 13.SD.W.09]|nr:hypothetical protein D931_02311 [Enterococcus faecium 13.SD.W.09]